MLLQCYSLGLLTLLTGKALIEEYVRGRFALSSSRGFLQGVCVCWLCLHCCHSLDTTYGLAVLVFAALPQLLVMIVVSPRILKNHVFVHSITHINKQLVEEVMDIMEVVRPAASTQR